MAKEKYKITAFKSRYKTVGIITEKTFEEIYFGFKNKVKRTKEKFSEYANASKATKLTIKDVGGFIGGETEGARRVNGIKITRKLLTLDIDSEMPNVLDYLKKTVNFYCLVHSTHSHTPTQNRLRIVAPLSREVNADEYEALGRRIAYQIENNKYATLPGLFDETTFQANRLMFFPSVSADGEYICEVLNLDMFAKEQNIIDVDKILDEYLDKNDIYEWFSPDKVDADQIGKNTLLNKNPLKARGMVGAFNRTYTITQAIEKFLPDVYKKERNGRYTYLNGDSHGGGIILKGDRIFYSHHGTDPANLFYRSAFDLVRIHKFGSYDDGFTPEKAIENNTFEKTESFQKMIEFCRTIPEVVAHSDNNIALSQRLEEEEKYVEELFSDSKEKEIVQHTEETTPDSAQSENSSPQETSQETSQDDDGANSDNQSENKESDNEDKVDSSEEEKEDKTWLIRLDGIKSKMKKLDIIFTNDKQIGNLFYFDTFRDNICFDRKPYWHRKFIPGSALRDKDMAHIRSYLDRVFDIRGEKMIDDAIVVEADKIQRNKVLEFFESLEWDGEERIEFFFNKFFKVPLNPFTRVAFKHWLVGAVSRIYRAGAPMDLLLIIKGKQGIGKSLFFKRLATMDFNEPGEHLYSDTKIDFNRAKDSYEQLEGVWIYEWKELAGMNMSDQESIKAFVDKTEDKFRRSYGRRNVEIKRRVAFGGSTNDTTPLRDRSGNRRFLVMDSPLQMNECYIKNDKLFTQEYKDQLIAEAIHLYKNGFNIFEWSVEELNWWEKSNKDNLAENDLIGSIESYLHMRRPKSWYSMPVEDMIEYFNRYDFENDVSTDPTWTNDSDLEEPEKVCIQELYRIALKQRDIQINRYHRDLIHQAIELLGWERTKRQRRFGQFGRQQPIVPKKEITNDDLPF